MSAEPDPRPASPWSPFGFPDYRSMWIMWVLSNMAMWMGNVAATWTMALLPVPPLWVALVHASVSAPPLLLGLPFGALADRRDHRELLLSAQAWLGVMALAQAALAFSGALSAPLLLATTFAFGCGFALRWPVFTAATVDLVPREHLSPALTLNAVSAHSARILGPLVAGAAIAAAGTSVVFALVALASAASFALVWRWRPAPRARSSRPAPFMAAIRDGVRFMVSTPATRGILVRVTMYFSTGSAVIALLPLVARRMDGAGAGTFSVLLAAMAAGSVSCMLILQRLRTWLSLDGLVFAGAAIQSLTLLVLAWTHSPVVAALMLFIAGAAWIAASNSLTLSTQLALPDELRARGMAIHQMGLMGSTAIGAAIWGQVATLTDVPTSMVVAGLIGVAGMAAVIKTIPTQR